MNKRSALIMFSVVFLLFALFLVTEALMFMPKQGVSTAADSAAKAALLTGGDDPDYIGSELLPEEKININTADSEQLQRLPGIGPVLAQAILDYRASDGNFSSVEDIIKVDGIGQGRFDAIAEYITVEDLEHENFGG